MLKNFRMSKPLVSNQSHTQSLHDSCISPLQGELQKIDIVYKYGESVP
jgi:hypothetical protein